MTIRQDVTFGLILLWGFTCALFLYAVGSKTIAAMAFIIYCFCVSLYNDAKKLDKEIQEH